MEHKENELTLGELKGVISGGYTVSGQYSSRKIDNRTSIEYPLTLDVLLVMALGDIQMVLNIHKSAIQAHQAQYLSEDDFLVEMIPTYFTVMEVKERISEFSGKVKETPELLTAVNKQYFNIIKQYYKEVVSNISNFNIQEKAEALTTGGSEDLLNS